MPYIMPKNFREPPPRRVPEPSAGYGRMQRQKESYRRDQLIRAELKRLAYNERNRVQAQQALYSNMGQQASQYRNFTYPLIVNPNEEFLGGTPLGFGGPNAYERFMQNRQVNTGEAEQGGYKWNPDIGGYQVDLGTPTSTGSYKIKDTMLEFPGKKGTTLIDEATRLREEAARMEYEREMSNLQDSRNIMQERQNEMANIERSFSQNGLKTPDYSRYYIDMDPLRRQYATLEQEAARYI